MTASHRVLVVTSVGSPAHAVTPVLAALEVAGLSVRALDVGRIGSRQGGTVDRVLKAVVGEFAARRLAHELRENPPDVAIAFDPGSAAALAAVRDESPRPAPVVAVVADLIPISAWQDSDADRYAAIDDDAAVTLADLGIPGDRILVVGPFGEIKFAEAGAAERSSLRDRFKITGKDPVVLIEVDGLGAEVTSQVALQLSLIDRPVTYLFAAGSDVDAAGVLRRQVPTLGMKAKLFGATADAPQLWRCADVVVIRPRPRSIARALLVGARVVAFAPDDRGAQLAAALEARGMGATAGTPLLIGSALEPLLSSRPVAPAGSDGAAAVADIAWVVASQRDDVIAERTSAERASTAARVETVAAAAEAAARMSAAPGELEDLSGDGGGVGEDLGADLGAASAEPALDLAEIARLRNRLATRMDRLKRSVADAQRRAAEWQSKHESAKKQGGADLAREAERNADLERQRMHNTLTEMAEVQSELARLDKAEQAAREQAARPRPRPAASAPPRGDTRQGGGTSQHAPAPSVDDLLDQMKKQGGTAPPPPKSSRGKPRKADGAVDDELAALKRKMAAKKRGKP